MKLTPMDVRKQSFRKSMRGFDPDEVRTFLELVGEEYEGLLQQNGMLNEKVRHLNEQLNRYYGMEKTLQNSLLTAERMGEEARERSRLEAETVLEDARLRAERILGDSRERLRMLSRETQELQRQKDLFVQRLQSFLQSQADLLTARRDDLNVIDELGQRADELRVEAGQPVGGAVELEEEPAARAQAAPPCRRAAEEEAPRRLLLEEDEGAVAEGEETPEGVLPAGGFFAPARQQPSFFEMGAEGRAKR
ncbi:MAG: DivIVA domain-containing protein [Candidatus Eisenbacteria bacterium]|uniref:DivIVA domain-containing protein n=1 Tax=Eiseniibacteriota bacterium TaxID=2212470 RepID=A0A938BM38_UNCEI|nr:DivIVA domain-containing protein [Candidatus Eisenbacteria bacterium]